MRTPVLYRIKDPKKLVSMGQLCLPGLEISDSRTLDQEWQGMVEASSRKKHGRAPRYIWPAKALTYRAGIN